MIGVAHDQSALPWREAEERGRELGRQGGQGGSGGREGVGCRAWGIWVYARNVHIGR